MKNITKAYGTEIVTIRDRDMMEQIRLKIDEVANWIEEKLEF